MFDRLAALGNCDGTIDPTNMSIAAKLPLAQIFTTPYIVEADVLMLGGGTVWVHRLLARHLASRARHECPPC